MSKLFQLTIHYINDGDCFFVVFKNLVCEIRHPYVPDQGRDQNSFAAAPVFSSQLEPTYIGKAIYTYLLKATAFWLQIY